MGYRNWVRNLAEKVGLPEVENQQTLVEIVGDYRVLVENHNSVLQYSGKAICIKAKHGCIKVCGSELFLKMMSSALLVISGKIDSVSIIRKNIERR